MLVWIRGRYGGRAESKKQDSDRQTRMQRADRKCGRRRKEVGEGGRTFPPSEGLPETNKQKFLVSEGQLLAHEKGQNQGGGQVGVRILPFSVTRDFGQSICSQDSI